MSSPGRGVRVLLRAKNRAGDTALHVAARHGRGAAVEALMGLAPALAAELNGAGVSPLYLAVVSGSVAAVAAVVAYGDDDAAAAGPMSQNARCTLLFSGVQATKDVLQASKGTLVKPSATKTLSQLKKALQEGPKKEEKAYQISRVPLYDFSTKNLNLQLLRRELTATKKGKGNDSNSGPLKSLSLEATSWKNGKRGSSNSEALKRRAAGDRSLSRPVLRHYRPGE